MSEEPKPSLPRVMLTCATTGSVRRETAACIMAVGRDARYLVETHYMNDRPYESALNRAASEVVAGKFDWWLHIDADQYWNGNPLNACDHDKDLVGFPAPIYRPGGGPDAGAPVMCFNAWSLTDPEDDTKVMPARADGKLQRVDIIGSGSFLMRVAALEGSAIDAPFARRYDSAGVASRGCDVEFCRKWREARLMIWADFANICGHFSTVDLLEVASDMSKLQNQESRDGAQAKNDSKGSGLIVRPGGRSV